MFMLFSGFYVVFFSDFDAVSLGLDLFYLFFFGLRLAQFGFCLFFLCVFLM